jgi:hypothetical protein
MIITQAHMASLLTQFPQASEQANMTKPLQLTPTLLRPLQDSAPSLTSTSGKPLLLVCVLLMVRPSQKGKIEMRASFEPEDEKQNTWHL